MKRIFLIAGVFIGALALWAEVSVISVTDENKHAKKEDFYHTFEYFISADGHKGSKCQATRISNRWFVTAAHCVKELCAKKCTLRMDLLDTPVSVLAKVTHTTKNPAVFVHPQYLSDLEVGKDVALLRLDVKRAPKTYYQRATEFGKPNRAISVERFNAWLAKNRRAKSQYWHALSPQLPPVAVFDNGNYVLDRKISVISIFDGVRDIKPDPHAVYYVKALGYAYTTDFGIRKGMSGSGVMTNTGELIGIISATIGADFFKGKQKVEHLNWFMFPVFNQDIVDFMKDTMGSDFYKVERKDAYPYLSRKTHKDFSTVVDVVKGLKKSKK